MEAKGDSTTVSQLLLVGIIVAFSAWLIQYNWKRLRLYKMAAQFDGPFAYPLIGNALLFVGSNERILNSVLKVCDDFPIARVWMGNRLFFAISRPEDMEAVMNHPNSLAKEDLYEYTRDVVGTGLFSAPLSKWKRFRKIISPTFNQKVLDSFVDIFVECSETMVEVLRKEVGKKDVEMFELMSKYTLDAICQTAMGVKMNMQTTDTRFCKVVTRSMQIIYERMFKVWYHLNIVFNSLPVYKEFQEYCRYLHDFTSNVIQEKKNAYFKKKEESKIQPEAQVEEFGKLKRKAFLELLIELSEEGERLSDVDLRDEVLTFMIAGSDTTASTLCFVFTMLGMHQDVQDECYEEIVNILGPGGIPEYSELHRFKYVEMVIKETLRLFPIGPLIVRKVNGDVKMPSGKILPENSSVVLTILHLHRNARYWPDPLKFDPNRFLPENVSRRNPYIYLPFSGGPRNCIGPKYAMMNMKVALAYLLRKYRIHTYYKTVEGVKIKQDIVLKPVNGYKLYLSLRE